MIAGLNEEDPFPSFTSNNILSIIDDELKYYNIHEMIDY